MNKKKEKITEIEKTLEKLIDIDLKSMKEEEIIELRSRVGKAVNEFYTLTNIELRRKKRSSQPNL
jgi:hypothetical protein